MPRRGCREICKIGAALLLLLDNTLEMINSMKASETGKLKSALSAIVIDNTNYDI